MANSTAREIAEQVVPNEAPGSRSPDYNRELRVTLAEQRIAAALADAEARVRQERHRCSGCGHRWEDRPAREGEWTGAELCGDCWRTVQPVLHAPILSARLAAVEQALREVIILLPERQTHRKRFIDIDEAAGSTYELEPTDWFKRILSVLGDPE